MTQVPDNLTEVVEYLSAMADALTGADIFQNCQHQNAIDVTNLTTYVGTITRNGQNWGKIETMPADVKVVKCKDCKKEFIEEKK